MSAENHKCIFSTTVKLAVCLYPDTPFPCNATKYASEILRKRKLILLPWLGTSPPCDMTTISLRLLDLILCSNCSNTFNKVLTTTCRHTVKLLFETSGHHFSLLKMFHGWSKHFTSRYDPSTPFYPHHPSHHYLPPKGRVEKSVPPRLCMLPMTFTKQIFNHKYLVPCWRYEKKSGLKNVGNKMYPTAI